MSVFVEVSDSLKITAFIETGKVFLSGESDSTNHWQVVYQNGKSRFKEKFSKVCHRHPIISFIKPVFQVLESEI